MVGFGKRIEGRTPRANTHEQVASPALAIAVARTLDFGEESAKFDIEGSKAYCLCCRAASFCLTSLASERINATAKLKSVCEHLQKVGRTESREHLQRMWRSCDGRARRRAPPCITSYLRLKRRDRRTDGRRAFHFSERVTAAHGKTRTFFLLSYPCVIDGHFVLARVNILLIKRRREYLSFGLTGETQYSDNEKYIFAKRNTAPIGQAFQRANPMA